jgi:hypothetical protein
MGVIFLDGESPSSPKQETRPRIQSEREAENEQEENY